MTPDLEKSIIEKHPSLFANIGQKGSPMNFGLEVGDGWAGIISTMCFILQQKDTDKKFRFDQIKEKFGLLRVYHSGGNQYMAGVVRMAEDISGRTCEMCGQPGEQRKGGWIKTLCDRCHAPPSDIAQRLRSEVAWEPEVGELMSLAATEIEVQRACTSAARDEIERLRKVSSQENLTPCPYVTGTVTRYCTLTTFTLTDAERLSIQWVIGEALSVDGVSIQATLRGLLERTK